MFKWGNFYSPWTETEMTQGSGQGRFGYWMDAWSPEQCSEVGGDLEGFYEVIRWRTYNQIKEFMNWVVKTDQTVEKDWKLGILADWGKRVSRPCLWKIRHTLSLCLSLCFLFCHMLLPYEALPHHGPNAAKATDCGHNSLPACMAVWSSVENGKCAS